MIKMICETCEAIFYWDGGYLDCPICGSEDICDFGDDDDEE